MDRTHEPARPGDERPLATRIRPVVVTWVLLAVATCVVVVASTPLPDPDPLSLLGAGALVLLVVVTSLVDFPVFHGEVEQSTGLGELGLLPVMLLLEPTLAIAVTLIGVSITEVVLTRGYGDRLAKLAFNTSFQVVAVALGSWLHFELIGPGLPVTAASLTVAAAAAGVDLAVNVVALASLEAAATQGAWRRTAGELISSLAFVSLASSFTGILLAVLVVEAPLALPLLLVPIVVYRGRTRERSAGVEALRVERDRLERTVAGLSDGVVLLGPDDRIEVWNPTMEVLLGLQRAEVIDRRLDEVGVDELREAAWDDRPGAGHVTVGGRTLQVRGGRLLGGRGTVLTVQDVSREAELARIREELVSRISHELRTPLTTVEGFIATLEHRWDELDDHERQRLTSIAGHGAHRLGQLIDKLLMWSGIEARAPHESTDVPRCDPVEVLRRRVVDDGSDLHLDVADEVGERVQVTIAETDLELVLDQLIANARLYGQPPIVFGVEPVPASEAAPDGVRLTVTDHGSGLAREFVPAVFQPFRQEGEGLQRTAQGLGLGLAIVHSLVTAAGGSVVVDESMHDGARFVITLPCVTSPGAP